MMVDNSIVVADGAMVRMSQGMDRAKAAIDAATRPCYVSARGDIRCGYGLLSHFCIGRERRRILSNALFSCRNCTAGQLAAVDDGHAIAVRCHAAGAKGRSQ